MSVLWRTLILLAASAVSAVPADKWKSTFDVDKANLGIVGNNPYFILEPGYRLHFANGSSASMMTVLDETKVIDGVTTRVVEDREEKNGQPVEITRDYYAIDSKTGDVYYFGEAVDSYKNGKIAGHKGSWLSGVDGASFGLMMPGHVNNGAAFYQERAPKQGAMDRSEVIETGVRISTPAGSFENCVHMKDSSKGELGADHKWYAHGVGLVRDGKMLLVKIDRARR